MVGKFKVITLCGSTRFKEDFIREQKRLTLEGNIVISVGLFGHSGDNEVWENMNEGALSKTKQMLDEMHKRKIDMSDEIFVINKNGYIGESTKNEIEYDHLHFNTLFLKRKKGLYNLHNFQMYNSGILEKKDFLKYKPNESYYERMVPFFEVLEEKKIEYNSDNITIPKALKLYRKIE